MLLKLIACNVFLREACLCVADSPHVIDVEFSELGEHARPAGLRELIQARVDAADAADAGGKAYDAVLLLYGVCGNATVGLRARRAPLVLPRAHDCATVLLGSRRRFEAHFKDAPSTPFGSGGFVERGSYFLHMTGEGGPAVVAGDAFAELVRRYGEEDARYVWSQMHPEDGPAQRTVFIDVPETAHLGHRAAFERKAAEAGKSVEHLSGDLRLIRMLVGGAWDPAEFLVVRPGEEVAGVYDWDEIVKGRRVE